MEGSIQSRKRGRRIVRIRDLTSAPRYAIIREIDRLQRELQRRQVVLSARQKLRPPLVLRLRTNWRSSYRADAP